MCYNFLVRLFDVDAFCLPPRFCLFKILLNPSIFNEKCACKFSHIGPNAIIRCQFFACLHHISASLLSCTQTDPCLLFHQCAMCDLVMSVI
jgi:hypothetical protein